MLLSEKITDGTMLQNLGIELGIPYPTIKISQSNNHADITQATRNMLFTWRSMIADSFKAWEVLTQALKRAGLAQYITEMMMVRK